MIDILSQMFGNTQLDRSTSAVAVAALASPSWMHFLQATSDVFTILLPILGGLWLIVQILGYLWRNFK